MDQIEDLCNRCWKLVQDFTAKHRAKRALSKPAIKSRALVFPPTPQIEVQSGYAVSLSRLLCNCLYLCSRCYLQQNLIEVVVKHAIDH